MRSNIFLNRYSLIARISFSLENSTHSHYFYSKALADLAAWEPKTFESIALVARERITQDGLWGINEKSTDNKVYYFNDKEYQSNKKIDQS